jgi:predicted small integral membrane protein
MGEKRNACRLLVGKPEGKRSLGRPRRTWVDNIRMDLLDLGWDDVDWIGLVQDKNTWRALVNSVLNHRVP